MKTMQKWAIGAVAVVFSMGLLASGAAAEGYIVGDNGASKQTCDFYQCGGKVIAVPSKTQAPQGGVMLGTGVIDGRAVNPKTNVLR